MHEGSFHSVVLAVPPLLSGTAYANVSCKREDLRGVLDRGACRPDSLCYIAGTREQPRVCQLAAKGKLHLQGWRLLEGLQPLNIVAIC